LRAADGRGDLYGYHQAAARSRWYRKGCGRGRGRGGPRKVRRGVTCLREGRSKPCAEAEARRSAKAGRGTAAGGGLRPLQHEKEQAHGRRCGKELENRRGMSVFILIEPGVMTCRREVMTFYLSISTFQYVPIIQFCAFYTAKLSRSPRKWYLIINNFMVLAPLIFPFHFHIPPPNSIFVLFYQFHHLYHPLYRTCVAN